ncbi:hypothetical protein ACFL6N_02570 [Thermodesulfobacteriota bacterium]
MTKYKNIHQAVSDNSTKLCKVPGCTNNRSRVSGYCIKHTSQNNRFGHPQHRRILKNEYEIERDECREIVMKNINHEGIKSAVKFIDDWLQAAWDERPGVVSPDHFRRLYDAGVKGLDILIECCALWLFHERRPRRIYDNRHLTYVMGNRIIRISPYWAKVTGPEHRAVGQHLRNNIGAIFVGVSHAVDKKERVDNERRMAMSTPLEV